ncbi:MAG: glycosyltransferase family 9 protein [Dehalococcoidia bacterium]
MSKQGCLVVRLGAIGDTILAVPALASLRRRFGRVVLVGSMPALTLLEGVVDRLIGVESPEAAALFDPSGRHDAAFLEAAGPLAGAVVWLRSPARVVAALRRLGISPLVVAPSLPAGPVHVVDHLLTTVDATPGALVELPVPEPCRDEAAAALAARGVTSAGTILLPGAGSNAKRWPVERFAALAGRISGPVAAIGGPADTEPLAILRALLPALPVVDDLPLRLLPAGLAGAAAVVANDSGPAHLAAAVGAPLVSLFGPTDPTVWAPRGPRVIIRRAPDGKMDDLTLNLVLSALDQLK